MQTTKEQNIYGFNQGQIEVFDQLVKFIEGRNPDGKMFVLKGYAGVGKSYIISKLIHHLNGKYKIAITGPTNKSVKNLERMSAFKKDPRIRYKTVHKLLGLTEEITDDGRQLFTPKGNEKNEIMLYDVLVVDEVSMLNDDLFIELHKYSSRLRIIFMGDPAQIPPVGNVDCIPFNPEKNILFDFITMQLTEIMRQAKGNPIIESSFVIRNNLNKLNPLHDLKTDFDGNRGIVWLNSNHKEERDKTMFLLNEHFNSDEFRLNSDYAKVIAWRNKTVDSMNSIIRKMMFGDDISKIVEGEKLIAKKPIMDGQIILFNTSDEFEVEEIEIGTESVRVVETDVRLSYYDCLVKYINAEGEEAKRSISILHEDSAAEFQMCLNMLKEVAIKTRGAKKSWLEYYGFMRRYADVNYAYAGTVHTAQGSTYKNVFVMEDDINMNRNTIEKNRILYTAYTRPTNILYVLKR